MKKSILIGSVGIILTFISLFCGDLYLAAQTENLPPTKPRTQTRKSGGTRGRCIDSDNRLVLIVPENKESLSAVPKTTLSHPTFFWHIAQKSSLPVKFTLVEPGRTIYTKELNLDKSGLVAVTLPKTVPPLEIGKEYRWTVSVICSRQNPSQNPYTQAWVKRVSLSSMVETEEKLGCDTYEKAEIWYDALACHLESNSTINTARLFQQIDLGYLFEGTSVYKSDLNLN
ncbi:MAG: DUF928 domain-containing protein [Xenococcaceae cyanobacterium]